MKKIGLISDTHGYWDTKYVKYFKECDEIWHAGDIGEIEITDQLNNIAQVKGVFGNIDNSTIRQEFPKEQIIQYGNQKVYMTHIGGRPVKYNSFSLKKLLHLTPSVFICGHSHICMVKYDHNHQLLYINPGAAGNYGIHKIRTIIRFELHINKIEKIEVIELGTR